MADLLWWGQDAVTVLHEDCYRLIPHRINQTVLQPEVAVLLAFMLYTRHNGRGTGASFDILQSQLTGSLRPPTSG